MQENVQPACDLASPAVTVSVRNAAHALAMVKSVPMDIYIAPLELYWSYLRR
jgi:hypothetical protein